MRGAKLWMEQSAEARLLVRDVLGRAADEARASSLDPERAGKRVEPFVVAWGALVELEDAAPAMCGSCKNLIEPGIPRYERRGVRICKSCFLGEQAKPSALDQMIDAFARVIPRARFRVLLESWSNPEGPGQFNRTVRVMVGETQIASESGRTTDDAVAALLEQLRKNGAAT
jgi:hypothetical protein